MLFRSKNVLAPLQPYADINERAVDSDSLLFSHLKYVLDNTLSNKECFSVSCMFGDTWQALLRLPPLEDGFG